MHKVFVLSLLIAISFATISVNVPRAYAHEQMAVYEKYRVRFNIMPDEPVIGKVGVFVTFDYKVELVNTQQEVQILFIRINVTSPRGPVAQHVYQGNRAFHIFTEGGLHKADAILTLADGSSIPTEFTVSALEEGVSLGPLETLLISLAVFAPASLTKAVHIITASVWVGTSVHAYLIARSTGNGRDKERNFQLKYEQSLFYATSFAVGIVISTGLFNASYKHQIGLTSLGVLVTTTYGLILLAKMLAVLAVLFIGGLIQFRYLPRLNRIELEDKQHKISATVKRLLVSEIMLFILIIYLATIFTSLHPTA